MKYVDFVSELRISGKHQLLFHGSPGGLSQKTLNKNVCKNIS